MLVKKCYVVGSRQRWDGVVYFTNSTNGLRLVSELNRQFMGFNTSTVDFLGYKPN
ncbi:hypothetical protein Slin_1428 [Spirosoma linguale DSM 74]|uniref:Uncharacterized protein n=1 Tax=Spirosoma linguale (strain ATCC 33905 / DSM 74 / LMG 10896 / Claus 1) TaxID=504472 RepID=D2QMZ4_SPILD|nr:hypothetical protein Slin_1428 [Spirosoma linguale DSM 74]